jgi:hypothetical protein
MIIDVHCHVGFSSRRVDPTIRRFSFEQTGAVGRPGYDSYLSSRFLRRPAWFLVRRWLGIDPKLGRGAELDAQIEAINERHWSNAESVDRLVLLAFDEYHDDGGSRPAFGQRSVRIQQPGAWHVHRSTGPIPVRRVDPPLPRPGRPKRVRHVG